MHRGYRTLCSTYTCIYLSTTTFLMHRSSSGKASPSAFWPTSCSAKRRANVVRGDWCRGVTVGRCCIRGGWARGERGLRRARAVCWCGESIHYYNHKPVRYARLSYITYWYFYLDTRSLHCKPQPSLVPRFLSLFLLSSSLRACALLLVDYL